MRRTQSACAVTALLSLAGAALAGQAEPMFLATNGTRGFVFHAADASAQQVAFGVASDLQCFQAVAKGVDGQILMHGMRPGGQGVWYHVQGGARSPNLIEIATTENWYNSITVVGQRMFAVKNFADDADQVVELDPFNFHELGVLGEYDIGIGGISWAPELSEFVVSDTRTNTFFGIGFDGDSLDDSLRVIGQAGIRWGANGLEYYQGHVYGTAIRGEDMRLVFGDVDLETGQFHVRIDLGDATLAGVGLGIIPAPGPIGLTGVGGLLIATRRRRR